MSFEFNLSSSSGEEDDAEDDDLKPSWRLSSSENEKQRNSAIGSPNLGLSLDETTTSKSSFLPSAQGGSPLMGSESDDDEEEDDDESQIDWEDADEGKEEGTRTATSQANEGATKLATDTNPPFLGSFPKTDVVIDFDANPTAEKNKTKKRKIKRLTKVGGLSPDMIEWLLQIRRTHMLCLVAKAIASSLACGRPVVHEASDGLLLEHIAQSLLPWNILRQYEKSTLPPTTSQLKQFLEWFAEFVNNVRERRLATLRANAAAGAPIQRQRRTRRRRQPTNNSVSAGFSMCSQLWQSSGEGQGVTNPKDLINRLEFLSPFHDDNPSFSIDANEFQRKIPPHEKTQLFVAMARVMGWRVRYVTALDPMDKDLTMNHPVFQLNLFRSIFQQQKHINGTNATQKRKRKAKTIDLTLESNKNNEDGSEDVSRNGIEILAWTEVLCRSNDMSVAEANASKQDKGGKLRWIHVDPSRKAFDDPRLVEHLYASVQNANNNKNEDGLGKKGNRKATKRRKISTPSNNNNNNNNISKRRREAVSYVLAVEHQWANEESNTSTSSCSSYPARLILSDVTQRYAMAWSETLALRGATRNEILTNGGQCMDQWWSQSLRKINRFYRRRVRAQRQEATTKKSGFSKTHASSQNQKSTKSARVHANGVVEIEDDSEEEEEIPTKDVDSDHGEEDDAENEATEERRELQAKVNQEAIPTSKAAFQKHPLYVIRSVLKSNQVLSPDASREGICGMFKGELVYKRKYVSEAFTAKKWLYRGQKVREKELAKPAKTVKARKSRSAKQFKALESYGVSDVRDQESILSTQEIKLDGEEDGTIDKLYGSWQTDAWSPPPVRPDETIPVNEHKNVELALINPGLAHIHLNQIAKVARKLAIPYAPCLLGFEIGGKPTIRGIVVHEHNVDILHEAHAEWESGNAERDIETKQREIYKRWRRLVVGLLTKERLEREYG